MGGIQSKKSYQVEKKEKKEGVERRQSARKEDRLSLFHQEEVKKNIAAAEQRNAEEERRKQKEVEHENKNVGEVTPEAGVIPLKDESQQNGEKEERKNEEDEIKFAEEAPPVRKITPDAVIIPLKDDSKIKEEERKIMERILHAGEKRENDEGVEDAKNELTVEEKKARSISTDNSIVFSRIEDDQDKKSEENNANVEGRESENDVVEVRIEAPKENVNGKQDEEASLEEEKQEIPKLNEETKKEDDVTVDQIVIENKILKIENKNVVVAVEGAPIVIIEPVENIDSNEDIKTSNEDNVARNSCDDVKIVNEDNIASEEIKTRKASVEDVKDSEAINEPKTLKSSNSEVSENNYEALDAPNKDSKASEDTKIEHEESKASESSNELQHQEVKPSNEDTPKKEVEVVTTEGEDVPKDEDSHEVTLKKIKEIEEEAKRLESEMNSSDLSKDGKQAIELNEKFTKCVIKLDSLKPREETAKSERKRVIKYIQGCLDKLERHVQDKSDSD